MSRDATDANHLRLLAMDVRRHLANLVMICDLLQLQGSDQVFVWDDIADMSEEGTTTLIHFTHVLRHLRRQ